MHPIRQNAKAEDATFALFLSTFKLGVGL